MDDDGEEINDCKDKSLFLRRTKLFHFTSKVINQVVLSKEASQMFTDSLEDLLKKVTSVINSGKSREVSEKDSSVP